MEKENDFGEIGRRITAMEAILENTVRLRTEFSKQLDALDTARESMQKLFRYYGSEEWFKDRERPIPDGVKAGVLSEDLVYDEITGIRDECFRMLELATDILKNVL